MTTLVTGGTGFVGSNLVRELVQSGEDVLVFHRSPADRLTNWYLAGTGASAHYVQVDITDREALARAVGHRPIHSIVHAAAVTANDTATERTLFRRTVEVNFMSMLNILEIARSVGARRVICVSSVGVYRQQSKPGERLTEDASIDPRRSLYATTKYSAELLALRFAELWGLDVRIVRLSGQYGPMERVTPSRPNMSAPYRFVRTALRGEEIQVRQEPVTKDWTYVVDTARAIAFLAAREALHHQIYNVSCGEGHSFIDLLAAVRSSLPEVRSRMANISEDTVTAQARDARSAPIMDIGRLQSEGDFQVKYSLKAGVAAYIGWWRDAVQQGLGDTLI